MVNGLLNSFTTSQAEQLGVMRWRLYDLRDSGDLVSLTRGVWRRTDAPPTAHESLLAVSLRAPRGTICLVSALAFHELTDEIPAEVHLAVPRGVAQPVIDYPPVKVHVFDANTYALGRERVEVSPGETVWIYSPVRTVVDAVRMRHQIGTDIAFGAARRLVESRMASIGELVEMSEILRCKGPMIELLEVLQA
jgi:predicted transcriptional regulator of viral defense system